MAAHAERGRGRVGALGVAIIVTSALVVILISTSVWWILLRGTVDVADGTPVSVNIPAGASTARIGTSLEEAGVIRNANMFRVRARITGADGEMKAGVYDLETGMAYGRVIEHLRTGPAVRRVTVTIPEGFVVEQIAARLEEQVGIPASETLALAKGGADEFVEAHPYLEGAHDGSLEGYLFPKTYSFREGSTAREALEVMIRQFDREVESVDVEAARARGLSFSQLVTLASMIEREARLEEERPLVSSVIHNRLRRDMRLEIDATIEYVLRANRFRLRNSDLRIDSPYNTYRNKGLPPGPIANPGLSSLKAAAEPADTDYLYYVLTGLDGSHTFTTNKTDFLEAKRKSKEVFGK